MSDLKPSDSILLGSLFIMLGSLFIAVAVFAFVVMSGQTFGQRCSVMHDNGSKAWADCVHKLAGSKGDE